MTSALGPRKEAAAHDHELALATKKRVYEDKRQNAVQPDSGLKPHEATQPQYKCQMFEDMFDLTSHARTHNGPARSYSRSRNAPKSPAVFDDTGHQTQMNRKQTEDTFTLKPNGHSGKQVPDVSELASTADSHSGHKNESLMQDTVTVKENIEDKDFEIGVSLEAAWVGLYKDHQIKDELVLGPVLLQPRDVACIVQNNNEKEQTSTVNSATAIDEKSVSQDSVTVKVDPEERCFDEGVTEGVRVDHLEYQIKDELLRDERCYVERVSSEAAEIGLYKNHQIKDELVLGPVLLQPRDVAFIVQNNNETEPTSTVDSPTANDEETVSQDSVTVKVEPEERCFDEGVTEAISVDHLECPIKDELVRDERCIEESVSPEGAEIGFYKDHQIKDELVLGPDLLQAPDVAFIVHRNNEQERSTVDNFITNSNDTVTVKVDPEERCFDERVTEAVAVDNLEHPLKCNHCDYATSFDILLSQHLMTHTGDQPDKHGAIKCSHCDYTSHYKSVVARHQMKHGSEKPFKCSYCNYTTRYKMDVSKHELIHTEKPFKCSHCNYSTRYESNVIKHELTHCEPFKSSYRDYTSHYQYKNFVTQHKLKLNNQKPFKCSHCNYRARFKSNVTRHELTHNKPFKCSHCDYTSHQKSAVARHQLKHSSEKPFKCSYCNYRTRYKGLLSKHELIHTEKPFKDCNYSTRYESNNFLKLYF